MPHREFINKYFSFVALSKIWINLKIIQIIENCEIGILNEKN